MKTLLARNLITLTVAASVAFLAGCLDQTRQATQPVPVSVAPPPVSEPAIVSRPEPAAANVSAPVAEVARLHQSGLDETVVKAFVEKSPNAVSPSADELIYLRDIGVSPRVITAMIQQTARMREQDATLRASQPSATPAAPQPNVTILAANLTPPAAQPAVPAPAPVVQQPVAPPVVVAPAPQVVVVAQPTPAALPPQVNVFYQQLQPYGTWMQVADVGWCWQPSVVIATPTWRPYADRGRWLHTDSGWYWQSDYAWGWAPFHYGRWMQHARSGWLWVPDTHWGPAWVVWRSSDAHCGWAPLPPSAVFVVGQGIHFGGTRVAIGFDFGLSRHHFTFVPFNRFCDRNPHYYALAPAVVQNVYQQTTVINNIRVNNNIVVNGGVPADRVAVLTRTEIRKVAVREAGPHEHSLQRLDKLEKSGNDLVIYRPVLNPNAPVKLMTLTNSKGESRTELVPVGALTGAKIAGRPVYDTTSTGVPVLTGYTTERPAPRTGQTAVVVHNNVNVTPPPAPVVATPPAPPVSEPKPKQAVKVFGLTPGGSHAQRTEDRAQPQPTVITPAPVNHNSLFRPLTPPQPVTSTSRNLTPPQPITNSPPPPAPPQPVAANPPPSRSEFRKPPTAPPPTSALPSPATASPPPSRAATVLPTPTYTPAPRPPVPPAAPVAARPIVSVTPPPQPSFAPTAPSSPNHHSPSKHELEKKKSS